MTKEEEFEELKKRIVQLLQYIEIARNSDHVVAHYMLTSENLAKFIKPLEKFLGQEEMCKKEIGTIVEEIAQGTKGRTLKERRGKLDKINKILKTS